MTDQTDGYCPHCGQPMPTGFATGTRSLSPDPNVRRHTDVPDPDGPLGYEVIMRLGDGQSHRLRGREHVPGASSSCGAVALRQGHAERPRQA